MTTYINYRDLESQMLYRHQHAPTWLKPSLGPTERIPFICVGMWHYARIRHVVDSVGCATYVVPAPATSEHLRLAWYHRKRPGRQGENYWYILEWYREWYFRKVVEETCGNLIIRNPWPRIFSVWMMSCGRKIYDSLGGSARIQTPTT